MTPDDLIRPSHVFLRVRAPDKPSLLQDIGRRAGAALRVPDAPIAAALAAREALGSSGIGLGIAVTHAAVPLLAAPAGFFAQLERPMEFDAVDEFLVDLVYVLLTPPNARENPLALLDAATRRLRIRAVADALRAARSAVAVCGLLTG